LNKLQPGKLSTKHEVKIAHNLLGFQVNL